MIYTVGRAGTEFFVPKKFRGIDSERFPLFRGRKHSFRGIPSSAEEPIPKLGTERNGMEFRGKKLVLRNRTSLDICIEVGGGSCVQT